MDKEQIAVIMCDPLNKITIHQIAVISQLLNKNQFNESNQITICGYFLSEICQRQCPV